MNAQTNEPVTSYGIIIYKIKDKIPYILMINRKDSLCYIDFLRGKYNPYNINYVQILFDKCSTEEKQRILTIDFDTLWKQLWLIDEIDKTHFMKDYEKGSSKFNILRNGYTCSKTNQLINFHYFMNQSKTNYQSSEWEFPKGRKERNESNKECAIREFQEETTILPNEYDLIVNIMPLSENYLGENKVKYRHIYYVAHLIDENKEIQLDKSNKEQCLEISEIKWLSYQDSLGHIRNYHKTRELVIHKIFSFLQKIDDYKFI